MWTVAALAADLAAGRTTSRALVETALARIALPAGEGARAFIKVHAASALADADQADRLRRAAAQEAVAAEQQGRGAPPEGCQHEEYCAPTAR